MMQRVDRLSAGPKPGSGGRVTLHIGVHTGAVVAGSLGSGAGGAYAVTGDTVNTASRLLTAAAPGTVLVSDATHAMVRHRFDFEPATELALRGKAQRGPRSSADRRARELASARGLADLGLEAPLVGRSDEIGRLLAAFDRMQAARPRSSAWSARPVPASRACWPSCSRGSQAMAGSPRPACAAPPARRSASRPTPPSARCFARPTGSAVTTRFEVARHKLQQGLRALGADADETDAVAQVLNYLLGIEEARPRDIEPEQLQRQITLAARALLERRLAQQPLMVVVDDLQWADAASVDLLREVVDQLADRPLMLLVSQRPDARPRMARARRQSIIELGPLADADARSLVGHLLGAGTDDVSPRCAISSPSRAPAATRCSSRRSFAAWPVAACWCGDDHWVCDAKCDAVDVPATLYGLLLSRIDRLGAEDRRALQEAAVLGAEFDSALLQRIASEPRIALRCAPPAGGGRSDPASTASGRSLALHPCVAARRGLPEPAADAAHRAAPAHRPRAGNPARRRITQAPERCEADAGSGRTGGAGPPLEPVAGQVARRALPARGRRLGARGLRQRRRDTPLRTCAAHADRGRGGPAAHDRDRDAARRASGSPTCSVCRGGAPRRWPSTKR